MARLGLPLLLGLTHGVADATAGALLATIVQTHSSGQALALVLLYNALGFAGQPAIGLLCDRGRCPHGVTLLGLLLLTLSTLVPHHPAGAVLLAGLGSAAFHVGAGAIALSATPNSAIGPACFTAPGVLGLALGGVLALAGYVLPWGLVLLILAGAMLGFPQPAPASQEAAGELLPEGQDSLLLVLLGAIALRSAVWNAVQVLHREPVTLLVELALAAAIGKLLGGFLADLWGWRRWAGLALALAIPLLTLAGTQTIPLLLGLALLQSVTPLTLAAIARLLPQHPATAAGLGLGLAIALGGFSLLSGVSQGFATAPVLLLTLGAVFLALNWALGQGRVES
ncbi:hypothetical protein BST81_18715 [Leptolyngbya sp. 'hensonii']|uniref:hypothetical protein n=1 Tax=Leptolyngbya sp. 'hensonii' TaxID=1922337 RepID=UPI00094FE3A5|nr:hypothetical protein [Leptolyngbya sp. 'hensonii']OLP17010.1 hypothetical protein BST81_18715 [Leptolyngbya sp. 'hensonii']